MQTKLIEVNLSLSSGCGANCVFCPEDRGTAIRTRNMPFEVAKKIIDEVTTEAFISKYGTQLMQVSENGDAFLNPKAVEIMRYIKARAPKMRIGVQTNFHHLDAEKLQIILREGLIDRLICNVDGSTETSFKAVKGSSMGLFMKNFTEFLRIRKECNSSLRVLVQVVTLRHYLDCVRTQLGHLPLKWKGDDALLDIQDDYEGVRALIQPMLARGDEITRSAVNMWAERGRVDPKTLDYSSHICPNMAVVFNYAFIAPDGSWYACCYDSNNRLNLGNVFERSVDEVANSRERELLMTKLYHKRFDLIGPPCDTVNCCVYYDYDPKTGAVFPAAAPSG